MRRWRDDSFERRDLPFAAIVGHGLLPLSLALYSINPSWIPGHSRRFVRRTNPGAGRFEGTDSRTDAETPKRNGRLLTFGIDVNGDVSAIRSWRLMLPPVKAESGFAEPHEIVPAETPTLSSAH